MGAIGAYECACRSLNMRKILIGAELEVHRCFIGLWANIEDS